MLYTLHISKQKENKSGKWQINLYYQRFNPRRMGIVRSPCDDLAATVWPPHGDRTIFIRSMSIKNRAMTARSSCGRRTVPVRRPYDDRNHVFTGYGESTGLRFLISYLTKSYDKS